MMPRGKRANGADGTPKPAAGTSMVPWDEELARDAEAAAAMEANAGGGNFFSTKGGVLSFNDMPMPGNQIAVVIADHILENVFYEGEFDATKPQAPVCFAFSHEEATLAPHPDVVAAGQAQHPQCHGCPMNEWDTAARGKGKACRNVRRLALLPAGLFDDRSGAFKPYDDPEHFSTVAAGYLKLPPTSVKGWATFVKQMAGGMKLPPHGLITRIRLVPDPTTQFKIVFDAISPVPKDLIPAVMKRRQEIKALIEFPYPLTLGSDGGPAAATNKPTPKRGAKAAPVPNNRPAVKRAAGSTKY